MTCWSLRAVGGLPGETLAEARTISQQSSSFLRHPHPLDRRPSSIESPSTSTSRRLTLLEWRTPSQVLLHHAGRHLDDLAPDCLLVQALVSLVPAQRPSEPPVSQASSRQFETEQTRERTCGNLRG